MDDGETSVRSIVFDCRSGAIAAGFLRDCSVNQTRLARTGVLPGCTAGEVWQGDSDVQVQDHGGQRRECGDDGHA